MATQWEYKVIRIFTSHAEKDLNAAGSDGWEAVATWGDATGTSCNVILKRQKS